MRKTLIVIFATTLFFTGCSFKVGYKKEYIQPNINQLIIKNNDTKVAIYTTKEMDNYKYIGRPNSYAGRATVLEIPIGIITKEITYNFFKQYFKYIDKISDINKVKKYNIVITPKIMNFTYSYTDNFYLIIPQVRFSLRVIVYKNNKIIMDRTYDSGVISGKGYSFSTKGYEEINKTLHKGLFNLLKKVNKDLVIAITDN